jgi:prepilin-type processing-associated H-X9-DG protein
VTEPYIKSIDVFRCPDDSSSSTLLDNTSYNGTAISYASNGYTAWDWKTANGFVMMGVIGMPEGNVGNRWTKSDAQVVSPADTIMLAEKHSDDDETFGSYGVQTFAGVESIIDGGYYYGEPSTGPTYIPNDANKDDLTSSTYGTGYNGAVSTDHASKTLANFLFVDGHVKAMRPTATNPPNSPGDSNDGQSIDNMWDADRQP